ncbi:MAG TPA: sensor domain-containing diguanylate cyclase [Spirochaetota bacterium]|nr:sensor domain-containing diguanylate cyclase [Spirochaetota bacterium]HPY02812.1 sensor domain-containing diguanylate cyclase [Spirochaetota bacterium]HQA52215.1 sensor domain-containing diguanylate cyclase [Spirochaetota bacterium]
MTLNPFFKRRKTLVMVGIILLAGFSATSLISFHFSRASLIKQIRTSELPLTSDNIYSEIQRDLIRPVFISSLMSHDTFVRDWVLHGESDHTKMTKYLREIKERYGAFTSFFVSDKSFIYYHADGILKKISPAEERDIWYFRVKNMKEDFEINVDPDMANRDTMTIFINYKVFDYMQKYIGATGVGLNASSVKNLIENYQNKYDRNIYFADKNGDIVLYGTAFDYGGKNIKNIPGIQDISSSILSGSEGSFTYHKNGKPVYLYTRFINEFQWYLIVEQDGSKAVRSMLSAMIMNLFISLLVTACVLLITNLIVTKYQHRIEHLAVTDKLTGVYNRQIFDVSIAASHNDYIRYDKPYSVIIADVDNFKFINDNYSHLAGDKMLCKTSEMIRSRIRESDTLFRWGGDEFLILMNNCNIENAYAVAEKIRLAVSEIKIISDNDIITISLSIGVAQNRKDEPIEGIISRADKKLYESKSAGRNKTTF